MKADQSILLEYDGVSLTYALPYISDEKDILAVKDVELNAGATGRYQTQQFSSTPVYAINRVASSSDHRIMVKDVSANSIDVDYAVANLTAVKATYGLNFYGFTVDSLRVAKEDSGVSLLKIDNVYVQSDEYAEYLKQLLSKYISLNVPKLELEVRGNPKYTIGSKLHIVSQAYNVDFTGILIRQDYKYDGGLSATLTVMNSEIIGD